jgi:uncharacterized protein YebE (UPF0316 family)
MVWKDCGYVSLTKDGKKILITLKRVRYIASLQELKEVLDGKKAYTLVLEYLKD